MFTSAMSVEAVVQPGNIAPKEVKAQTYPSNTRLVTMQNPAAANS